MKNQQASPDFTTFVLPEHIKEKLKFNSTGLIPVVVQAADTHEVLMMAWMDEHAVAYTMSTRQGTYFSRSRNEYWVKGLTSGNVQEVVSMAHDCDGDTILLQVRQTGGACHTGTRTCFDDGLMLEKPS